MGSLYLLDLPSVLRAAGLDVVEEPGWQTRARSSGGYAPEGPVGIVCHHTASGPATDGQPDVDFMCYRSSIKPVANVYINRAGRWWVMAAGSTNNAGKGGPRGVIPLDGANSRVIGIEAGNLGTGEPWPLAQQESYVIGARALWQAYDIDIGMIFSHKEWTDPSCPGRKIDPWGPSRWAGSSTWNMDAFRGDVFLGWPGEPPIPPEPIPPPTDWFTEMIAMLPTLRQGDRGEHVQSMQMLMSARGTWSDTAANHDGVFGAGTADYLRRFQASRGLAQDGVCGPQTWTALLTRI